MVLIILKHDNTLKIKIDLPNFFTSRNMPSMGKKLKSQTCFHKVTAPKDQASPVKQTSLKLDSLDSTSSVKKQTLKIIIY